MDFIYLKDKPHMPFWVVIKVTWGNLKHP